MIKDLIVVEQLPVITERLRQVSEHIDMKIAEAKALAVTDDTVKTVKSMRAGMSKDFAELEERRKAVKASVLAPYDAFETVYKQFVSDKYRQADADLKAEIDRVEGITKAKKTDEVKAYFEEYAASKHVDFILWENAGIKVGLSDTVKSLKASAKAFVDRICDDLALIESQKHKEEILLEYRRSLSASLAITTVMARHKAIEEQRVRKAEIEAMKAAEADAAKRVEAHVPAPIAPPVPLAPVADDPVKTLAFRVTAPLSMLRKLKRFLDEGGYQYE